MRPEYRNVRGMFTVVFTPHFLLAGHYRAGLSPMDFTDAHFVSVWEVIPEDECAGYPYLDGFIYCKGKWNQLRSRWELELISYTPGTYFHTESRDYAVLVNPPVRA